MRRFAPIAIGLAIAAGVVSADTTVPDAKDAKPKKVDPNPDKLDTMVLRDSSGGTYVIVGRNAKLGSGERTVFYGTGTTLYQQYNVSFAGGHNGTWSVSMWTPRINLAFTNGSIHSKTDGTFFKDCNGIDDAVLVEVTGAKATEVFEKYAFMDQLHKRGAHALARDDNGIYYYVDAVRTSLKDGGAGVGHRLYIGKKGVMKQVPLTDVTTDPGGELYISRLGTLKFDLIREPPVNGIIATRRVATWVKGTRKTELTTLDVKNGPDLSALIYRDLGIYGPLGTICDNS